VILAEDLYEDLELWYPLVRLREAGASVSVIAPEEFASEETMADYASKIEARIR
jgi:protease I